MDLAYLPECMSYAYLRRNNHWEQPYSEINPNQKKSVSHCTEVKVDKKNCQICKEKQKRNLNTYIKDKFRRDSEGSTCIREEDEDTDPEIYSSNKTVNNCSKKRTISESS